MFHPDQRYDVRMLQQQELQIEAARMRLAAQVSDARNDLLARIGATSRVLTLRLGRWLRLAPISSAHTSKG